jgi:hypothetical protein
MTGARALDGGGHAPKTRTGSECCSGQKTYGSLLVSTREHAARTCGFFFVSVRTAQLPYGLVTLHAAP